MFSRLGVPRKPPKRLSSAIKRWRAQAGTGRTPDSGQCWEEICIDCGFIWLSAVRKIEPNTTVRVPKNARWGLRGTMLIGAYRCVDRAACNRRRRAAYNGR